MKMKHEEALSLSSSALCTLRYLLFCVTLIPTSSFVSAATLYSNETDRLALLDFKHRISYDPHGVVLNSWNDSVHHCYWQGVSCGRKHQRVVALRLAKMGLVGTISPHIGNLTFLMGVDLYRNGFHGQIPGQIGGLRRLRHLVLCDNALTGDLVAANLSHCLQLRTLYLAQNGVRGKIPTDLSDLNKVQLLALGRNQLTGEIPPTFGNLSSLQILGLEFNHLEGSIPIEITQCWSLNEVSFAGNNLTGKLPSTFFNTTSIATFSVGENSLQGSIPSYIGDTMPNLEIFEIGGNKFYGTIPTSFLNASKLQLLDLGVNYFIGKVPDNIGMLKDLQNLNLPYNLLGSNNGPPDDLAFITSLSNCSSLEHLSIFRNRFEGKLPNAIANLSSKLQYLVLGKNKISGTIPKEIKNLGSLIALALGENLLSGGIPSEIGDLQKLQVLELNQNQFSGKMPPTICNLTFLSRFNASNNNLDGNIPSKVENFRNMYSLDLSHNKLNGTVPQQVFYLLSLSKTLDLSSNSFTGPLSPAVGKLKTLSELHISGNKLLGEIPDAIGDCLSLQYLDMHANLFEGKIPPSFVFLKSIRHLDISNNKLIGEIPKELQKLPLLQYLNLSFNDLEGEVPTVGVFAVATNVSLLGNKKLCGGIPELKLPPCPVKKTKHRKHSKLLIVIFTCICLSLVFASLIAFLTLCWRKEKRMKSAKLSKVEKLSKISYNELHRATEGFSETNLIGSGSFGSVYKGRFEQDGEQTIAVKVLDLLKNGASKSFLAECKVLRNIRHRNLVPILTCCSSCDFAGNDFKALVYEFMENGDLDKWLHTHLSSVLSVLQRLNIAIDVASALHYLHDDCEPTVVHCDLKPSNILLDEDLTAHVGDFGISRLYSCTFGDLIGEQTSTIGLKGSIGYVPPEYGIGAKASTFGDVYSFGILLLEMFTAKRPTDDLFNSEYNSLCEYVEIALPEHVIEIVDPSLSACLESSHGITPDVELENDGNLVEIEESKVHNFFLSIFKIGLTCASRSPMDRMHMNEVSRELQRIKKAFFA